MRALAERRSLLLGSFGALVVTGLVTGIVAGFSIAIGNALATRYVLRSPRGP